MIRSMCRKSLLFRFRMNRLQTTGFTSSANSVSLENLDWARKLLVERFRLPEDRANLVLIKWLLNDSAGTSLDRDPAKFSAKIDLLQQNFSAPDVGHNLHLFNLPTEQIRNMVLVLTELGFDRLEVKLLDALPTLMDKTIVELKLNGIYDADKNVPECLLHFLQQQKKFPIPPELVTDFRNEFETNADIDIDSCVLNDVRKRLACLLLQRMVDCSRQVAMHTVERLECVDGHMFHRTSLTRMAANLQIFVTINLPLNLLIKNFDFLCHCDTENLSTLVHLEPFQTNPDLRAAFFNRRKLVNVDAELIAQRMDLILGKYKCSIQQLINCIFILEFPAEQIQKNFQLLNENPELRRHSAAEDFLRLVWNINVAVANLKILKERDISSKYVTIHNLLKPNGKFLTMVQNNTFKLTLNSFVQMHFSTSLKEIKNKIGKFKTSTRTLNSNNAENIVNFFRQNGLSDEQIINGIYLIYFDFEKIQTVWDRMFTYPEVKQSNIDWRRHANVLQLLFHYVEKLQK